MRQLAKHASIGNDYKAFMHIFERRLKALEHQLVGVDLFLLPMADEFQGEYTPDAAKRLPFVTGFDGSAGFCAFWAKPQDGRVHTLFVDGRYVLQAPGQVPDAVKVVNIGETSLTQWLAKQGQGLRIGFDPWLVTHQQREGWQEALSEQGAVWVSLASNPVDAIWENQPPWPAEPVTLHPTEHAGQSYAEKRAAIVARLVEKNADAQLLTLPDGINWLLNIRGSDIPFNPLLLCYFLLRADGSGVLFLNERPFGFDVSKFLQAHRIEVHDLPFLGTESKGVVSGVKGRILVDPATAAYGWWQLADAAGWKLIAATDPTLLPKACKNAVEVDGIRTAHQRDGIALSRCLAWLDRKAETGELPTELEVVDRLEDFRAEGAEYRGASFATIAGSGPNGAIVHYRADASSNRRLAKNELFLLDSGGQYPGGTTDVTRTITIGPATSVMREHFTRVLKGHIALATARFPAGTTGSQLDVLARQYLWQVGLDYDHGTGHGVGAYLCVHEGPQRISKRGSTVALQPGMILSNEPGYYKAGAYGIRIENLVLVVDVSPSSRAERSNPSSTEGWIATAAQQLPRNDTMLGFETLTLAPIDTRMVEVSLLSNDERNWLNSYHARVCKALADDMPKQDLQWLVNACRAI
jgi:Xaa-Pro aminopeptidase